MKLHIVIIVFFTLFLKAEEYEMGHGLKVDKNLNLGAYFSVDYETGDKKKQFRVDDVAVMAYGNIEPELSYLLELESSPFYEKNYTADTSTSDRVFHFERFYINYAHSDTINLRVGKQITPIGYWNLEPINVLRNTTSNPLYSYEMFPKLLTGADLYGYLDEDNTLKYHLFLQRNNDLDDEYINIRNNHFFGLSVEYDLSSEISFGGAVAEYITLDNKHVRLMQLNAKYDDYPFALKAEMAYNTVEKRARSKSYQFGGYAQGVYNFNVQHAIIGRYEYFDNDERGKLNHIGVFGYSYRPVYSISYKAEHQFNSDSKSSKSIISFSVLF